ncbi:7,8-dihydro-6-hydroxymethylpterin-pyrophosphokina se [Gluconacetobacter liquefaciens]|uniref:2-amino-4-hydroxy-6-hydroxymethyldihydropteridine pyrophosphokinase n=1 Tax=Gluconacetobacter liquefaciens TaxID=89584 RepID=A0A370G5T5_GLULI|nr:2-amino-4-hydroxy-6-hydroxymethyldihydropteridine diphosphokinase [Gluconacetobacter liquefaciens]MBB2187560.1 2-amino-4-hydroxy-6-hydroxymethyldihydropteridine diphosphokinase [Gluconacetobacter liquefaciens]RDI37403.1 2-amino-4-hydroxy-6-hydroxymethyldihydropteridine diphosphokinase [Gluconacetobacter liquefaciens]GBR00183.1 2-amino-4-hydroxy-6-hydroxymethyldihydropteridine pyrophosphokinase [Gluconacetobacter liquefaciens NRIC 0522]GEB38623.1 7,8-dihydro-6-hydroxymethylpterin-pyrophosphok
MILIAIGANLPREGGSTPRETCRWAVGRITAIPGLRVVAVSPWYESAPVPPSGQPPYVNGVVNVAGEIDPAALLAALQAIEAEAGRRRTVANAARPLDLDIVAMGSCVRDAPDPILPHPRAEDRAFVLLPLRDVAPDWRNPRTGHRVGEAIAALPVQEIRRLDGA